MLRPDEGGDNTMNDNSLDADLDFNHDLEEVRAQTGRASINAPHAKSYGVSSVKNFY